MNAAFAESFIHRPSGSLPRAVWLFLRSRWNPSSYRVMGRQLQPLCLWHALHLEIAESPYISDAPASDEPVIDLDVASAICATLPLEIPAWPVLRSRMDRLRLRFYRGRLPGESLRFAAYLRDYHASPKRWDAASGGKTFACPWPLIVAARLMHQGKMSREAAWSVGLGEALWTKDALQEINKVETGIVTEVEIKALREAGYDVG